MTSKKQWLKDTTALCAEIRPEDGIDPRKVVQKSNRSNKHRKTYQVCKSAEKTLNLVLAGESVEALLRELSICAVEPNPDSSRLLVIVEPISTTISLDKRDVLKALQRAEGRLRSAIATTINRKRVPQLTFQFLSPMEVPW